MTLVAIAAAASTRTFPDGFTSDCVVEDSMSARSASRRTTRS
jgi:hypothetical protein